ncbi:MAG TPA: 2-oxoacid:acceptor oxidoreductase family protein [Oscillospiraceae bacterium]|nr:2-oxoacid:acceptor oxidoreductase family protein [Oscillospiraceae bacterium]
MTNEIILAGFGGQGILFAGKALAYGGLIDEKEVSWLPSYGPEMRGGTANCSVCISDNPIGSPLVLEPDLLIAMNTPSFEKFINAVKTGGKAFIDSTMVDAKTERTDIEIFYIPATQLASDNNLSGMANIILLGKLMKETALISTQTVEKAMAKCIPPKKANLLESNLKAISIGMNI